MNVKEFILKFKSGYLWGNLMAMCAVVLLLSAGVMIGVDIYTHHGEAITIPDVRRHSIDDAKKVLENMGFIVEITDTGYVKALPPGTVLEQRPLGGSVVKSGRIIYLTINADSTPTLTFPDIIDNCSYREAHARLTSMGFKLAAPQYVPGEKDWVYGVTVRGRNVVTGDKISIEDVLVIQVGSGMRDEADSVYVTDPEYEFPEVGDIGGGDDDEFEIITDDE